MNSVEETINKLAKNAVDQGKIIEAGWLAMKIMAVPAGATEAQMRDMRNCFFAGAQHLYASILAVLDPGSDATEQDMARMTLIDEELKQFVAKLKAEILT